MLRCLHIPWFIYLAAILSAGLPRAVAEGTAKPERVVVAVHAGERQRFAGFGASQVTRAQSYAPLPAAMREELARLVWHDLKFRTLRLWFATGEYSPQPGERKPEGFVSRYVSSGLIADARKQGMATLLLAPTGVPEYMKQPGTGKDGKPLRSLRDEAVGDYAELLADFIRQLRDEQGVLITVTGISNEPNDHNVFSTPQMVAVVKALRKALDRRGLQPVGIIAPETASCDRVAYEMVDALKADPEAWRALRGIATHSYNMAADARILQRIEGTGKEYWMTESSDPGPEEPGDQKRAAMTAARFLNDMNHGVTHWVWFIAYEKSDPRDNGTRIIRYDLPPDARIVRFAKYDAFRQLTEAFDIGATFRACESDHRLPNAEMLWSYGQKPAINIAAARNPDGSWGIGLSNTTGIASNWDGARFYPAASYEVTLHLEELKEVPLTRFVLRHSSGEEKVVEARNGELTVPLAPLEVVTLRSLR